jgi:hypothetical protein
MLFLSVCLLTTSGLIWGFFTYNASKQRPKLKLFNITELNTKVDKFNTETAACMSLEQLQEAGENRHLYSWILLRKRGGGLNTPSATPKRRRDIN